MSLNADELIRIHIGNLVVQIVTLQAEVSRLQAENDALKTSVGPTEKQG